MSWFLWIFFSLCATWTVFITRISYSMLNVKMKHIRNPPMKEFSWTPCAARYDGVEWNKVGLYFGAIVLIPWRACILICLLTFALIQVSLGWLLFGNGDVKKAQSNMYYKWTGFWLRKICRSLIFLCFGITRYEHLR